MINRLINFQALKGEFKNGTELSRRLESDYELRKEIEILSKKFLNKPVSGCSNCFADTFHQLMRLQPEEAQKKADCPFVLRRGALLHDVVNFDISLNVTQANITIEKALYHLKTNPNSVRFFDVLPEGWEQMVAEYKLTGEVETETEKTPVKKVRKPKAE